MVDGRCGMDKRACPQLTGCKRSEAKRGQDRNAMTKKTITRFTGRVRVRTSPLILNNPECSKLISLCQVWSQVEKYRHCKKVLASCSGFFYYKAWLRIHASSPFFIRQRTSYSGIDRNSEKRPSENSKHPPVVSFHAVKILWNDLVRYIKRS